MYPIHQSEIHTIIVVFLSPRSTMFLCFLRRYFLHNQAPPFERRRGARAKSTAGMIINYAFTVNNHRSKIERRMHDKKICVHESRIKINRRKKKAQKIFQTPKKVRGAEWNELLNNSFRFLLLLFYTFIRHTHGIWVAAASVFLRTTRKILMQASFF